MTCPHGVLDTGDSTCHVCFNARNDRARKRLDAVAYLTGRGALVLALVIFGWFSLQREAREEGEPLTYSPPPFYPRFKIDERYERYEIGGPSALLGPVEASVKPPLEPGPTSMPCPFCPRLRPVPPPRFELSRVLVGTDCSCGRDLELRLVVRDAVIWRGCSLCLRDAVASVGSPR